MKHTNPSKYETRNLNATRVVEADPEGGEPLLRKRTKIMGLQVPTISLIIAAGVAMVLLSYVLIRLLSTRMVVHFGLIAGVLLLIGNLREFLRNTYTSPTLPPDHSIPLMNTLIGGSLVCVWMASVFTNLFWLLAIVLLLMAAPLALARASAYTVYVETARRATERIRRTIGRL